MKIAVFDSGLGGVTVLKELIVKNPNEYIYYADQKNLPYGSKTKEELEKIATEIFTEVLKKNIDICVCACGTLSSNASDKLDNLSKKYNVPWIGIVETLSSACSKYNGKNALLIGTCATIKSKVLENKIKEKMSKSLIYSKACEDFVKVIENQNSSETDLLDVTKKYLEEYKDKVEIVICGCTHYILYEKYIKEVLGNVIVIDAADQISKELKSITDDFDLTKKSTVEMFTSKYSEDFKNKFNKLINL